MIDFSSVIYVFVNYFISIVSAYVNRGHNEPKEMTSCKQLHTMNPLLDFASCIIFIVVVIGL